MMNQVTLAQREFISSYDLTTIDGVPNSNLRSGFHADDGFIWTIFNDGTLVRFDGVELKKFNDPSIQFGGESQLIPINKNQFWIVSNNLGESSLQITIFNPKTEDFSSLWSSPHRKPPFSKDNVHGINKNYDGTIWIHTEGSIFEFQNGRFTLWSNLSILSVGLIQKMSNNRACIVKLLNDSIEVLHQTRSGKILSSSVQGNTVRASFLPVVQQSSDGGTETFLSLSHGSTEHSLVKSSARNPFEIIDTINGTSYNTYSSDGRLIFKRAPNKLFTYTTEMKELYSCDIPYLSAPYFTDNQDGIWFPNGKGKISRIYSSENKFNVYHNIQPQFQWQNAARGIIEGPRNGVFMCFNNGINHVLKDGSIQFLEPGKSIESFDFFGLELQEDNKTLWITERGKVMKMNALTYEYERIPTEKKVSVFWQPYEDRNHKIWIGSSGGLHYYDPKQEKIIQFIATKQFEALQQSSVFGFYENDRGMWLSTTKGVFLLQAEKGIVEHYHLEGKGKYRLPFNIVTHLQEDKDGTLWMASKGGGLIHYYPKTGEIEQYTTANGLVDNVIYACYLDRYGQIWLPSNSGLMCFNKKTKEVIHYTTADGIPNLEFNTISHHRGKNGRLYFGGIKGVISFFPKDLVPKDDPQPIHLTNYIKINNQNVQYLNSSTNVVSTNRITLLPDDKMIKLRFALTSLMDPKNHSYQYKIKELNSEWVVLNQPEITLNNLPYGEYTLLLRAKSAGMIWQYYPSSIKLSVPKPFYLTWWFIGLVLILLVSTTYAVLRWQTYRLNQRKLELEKIVLERTAEIVKQAEELKTLDKMKSQFFANVSHELRTPLTLILGPVHSLQEESKIGSTDKQLKKNLDVIERNAENLLGIVDEVLELSKLNAGKVELKEENIVFKDYLKQIWSSFESTADLRNIKFRFIYHPSVKLKLKVDRNKFEKIINNLLSNAFKFTADGGEIQLEITEKGSTILVSVSDTGSGIDEEDLPYVFDRFYQSKSPKFTAHGGTGIGLALCYEMTKLMKGKIWAESTVNVGSQFFVEIPKKTSDFDGSIKTNERGKSSPKMDAAWEAIQKAQTILLVEDNSDMREYIRSLLRGDHTILLAENGQKGLDLVESKGKQIDLIISDVMMPVMDGFTMLQQLKEHDQWRNIPVIMLTARAAEEDKLHALTIGVDDYLTKPFSTAELQARVKNLIANYESRKSWQEEALTIPVITNTGEDERKTEDENAGNLEEQELKITSKQDLIWIKKVESIISENISNENFDIETLAEQMFVSKRQFERKIKKITGLSPAKIVLEVRMQKAREYLEKDAFQTVSEVSYAIGIQTPSYFSNVYSKRFGKRPSAYFS